LSTHCVGAGLADARGVVRLRGVAVVELADVAAGALNRCPHALDRVEPGAGGGLGDLVAAVAVGVLEDLAHEVARHRRVLGVEDGHQEALADAGALLVAGRFDQVDEPALVEFRLGLDGWTWVR
jgi:hypothetical protein